MDDDLSAHSRRRSGDVMVMFESAGVFYVERNVDKMMTWLIAEICAIDCVHKQRNRNKSFPYLNMQFVYLLIPKRSEYNRISKQNKVYKNALQIIQCIFQIQSGIVILVVEAFERYENHCKSLI